MRRMQAFLAQGHRAVGCTVLGLVAGCAATGDGPPPLLRAATGQTRAGEEAYLSGHAAEAVPALGEAVRLHLAAGDLPGAARALLNLALALRAAGDATAAAATAARLHDLTPAAQQQAREGAPAEAAVELAAASAWLDALLALDANDFPTASALLATAPGPLASSSPWPGRVETLRAELALGEGRFADALVHARAGQAASAAAKDRAEEARARRFAGAAHVRLGQWPEAREDFLAALRIEETLGGGGRMAGDLTQLAAIAGQLGDSSAAQWYTQRARAITDARSR